jgi:hypothetical protein
MYPHIDDPERQLCCLEQVAPAWLTLGALRLTSS